MKTRDIEGPIALYDLTRDVEPGFIRLKSNGKTVAYVLLATHYDEEDIGYMTDPEFWAMIRERRESDEGIPLEQVKAELEERERRERRARVLRKERPARKAKRR